jgi:molybdopterin molybdotransferase
MLTVEEALQKILNEISVLDTENVAILESLGQVLAEDIHSVINVPPLDNSAMDGYAVRAADTKGASEKTPKILKVIDTVIAGSISKKEVTSGSAIRIMTGAPIPKGADSVIQFEDTDEAKRKQESPDKPVTKVSIFQTVKAGQNIRLAGEDVKRGSLILKKGTVIRPGEIGVMASIGYGRVKVIRRPIVSVLSTGNELMEIYEPLQQGRIYNSNSYSIASLVKRYGGIPKVLGIARDNEKELAAKLKEAQYSDLILTTGGVSMGDYDMVKDILARDGKMVFWKVKVKPGKPLAFGKIKGKTRTGQDKEIPHLGLPGNATSCMVSFELFVRPAILKMMGKTKLEKPSIPVVVNDTLVNDAGRRIYNRAVTEKLDGHYVAKLTGPQGSGILTSMALANSLVIIPEDKEKVNKGETAQALMLDWNEEVET